MTIRLEGNWDKGFAYDVHTLSSVYLGPDEFGHDQWDTTRSEMGELLYQLKYRADKTVLPKIVSLLDRFKGIEKFDFIVPAPASNTVRAIQPVLEIARALGERRSVNVANVLTKRVGGPELKNVSDAEKREQLLRNLISVENKSKLPGAKVLLIDDLYRSGATLQVCTDMLLTHAKVEKVGVLTMTKTRSRR